MMAGFAERKHIAPGQIMAGLAGSFGVVKNQEQIPNGGILILLHRELEFRLDYGQAATDGG